MKLLAFSIFTMHSANMCYFDGKKLYYYKPERHLQIKHWVNYESYEDQMSYSRANLAIQEYQKHLRNVHGVSFEDMDFICIPNRFKSSKNNEKIIQINHHNLHALGAEMMMDIKPKFSFVLDGKGGNLSWAVFKDDKLIESNDFLLHGSMGYGVHVLANRLNIEGSILDRPGKMMGLQSYGKVDENYLKLMRKYDMFQLGPNFHVRPPQNTQLFCFQHWIDYKGSSPTAEISKLDWVRTVHERCGEIILESFKRFAKSEDYISYTGGCAQNVIWNTLLKKHFKNLYIPPFCTDEGLSFGGIEYLRLLNNLPKFDMSEFPFIQSDEAPNTIITIENIKQIAKLLAAGKIVAWYQGHGEVGPRALGNRSLLMDPRTSNGKELMNTIKNREEYRPFGASVLSEYAEEYFGLNFANPFMLYVGTTKVDNLQSITHVDGTCRAQTVDKDGSSFRLLLEEFFKLTDCPVLMNTSLNISGKPIAGHIDDAMKEFKNKPIDILAIGNELYTKEKEI